jgi:peroxiredoxin
LANGTKEFTARGARVAAITLGEPAETREFCGARAPGVFCYADPQQQAYRAFGLGQARANEIVTAGVMMAGMQATLEGHLPGIPVGDTLQMPGTFVIGPDGRIRLAYYSRTIADHPDNKQLLSVL